MNSHRLVALAAASVLAVTVGGAAGCTSGAADSADPGGGGGAGGPRAPGLGCEVDDDCVPVSATCCGCPGFAVSVDDPLAGACDELGCQEPVACGAAVARCDLGACVLTCPEVVCNLACAGGFAVDAGGCETCACAEMPPEAECAADEECVQVAADCCGCGAGGVDVAVPAGDADAFTAALDCDPAAVCPDVDACEVGASPRCQLGRCALVVDGGGQACGSNTACPSGQQCVIGGAGPADGLGTCQPT
ncbi:MAG: hypothetical protein R2939_21060 [Kofleriaceae bacterium]